MAVLELGPQSARGNTLDGSQYDGIIHYFRHRDVGGVFTTEGYEVISRASVDLKNGGAIHKSLDRVSKLALVREFLSGNTQGFSAKNRVATAGEMGALILSS